MSAHTTKAKRRPMLIVCLIINIGILVLFKYIIVDLPLGMSFYTLQTMSYLIDCYRTQNAEYTERNPFKLALFTAFFPQLLQGPMSRFDVLRKTLYEPHQYDAAHFTEGLLRVAFGFFKKLVIADALMPLLRTYCNSVGEYLFAMLLYAVALYCDFTGGIDVTIGVAKMFGIQLTENFIRPYFAKSIEEFWRGWHITMGAWFRDYVFWPLMVSGPFMRLSTFCRKHFGKRVAKRLPVWIATILTWLLTGMWHGASAYFVLWGAVNGVVILLSQEFEPIYARFQHRFPDLSKRRWYSALSVSRCFALMTLIRGINLIGIGFTPNITIDFSAARWIVLSCAVAITVMYKPPNTNFARFCVALAFAMAVIVFGSYGIGYDSSSFIYTRF